MGELANLTTMLTLPCAALPTTTQPPNRNFFALGTAVGRYITAKRDKRDVEFFSCFQQTRPIARS